MGRLQILVAALVWALGPAEVVLAIEADSGIEAIESCVSQNLRAQSSVQSVVMTPRDRIGSERSIGAKVYWKRFDDGFSRLLARFTEPVDIDGAGFLLVETDKRAEMFLYMPEIRKTRRITSQTLRGSIYGTDFSYEDFERLQGFNHDEKPTRLADAEVGSRAVFLLEARPAPDSGSAYDKVLSYVDQERCVPLKVELFESGERLRKVLEIDPERVTLEGESWVPRHFLMRDVRDETQTQLEILDIELGREIPDRAFRLDRLARSRDP